MALISHIKRRTLSASGAEPPEIDDARIKQVTQRFDVNIVFSLSLADAGLTRTTGLQHCTNLTALDLTRNAITRLEGLEPLQQLRTLSLADNRLTSLQGLPAGLPALERLNLQGNHLASLPSLCLDTLKDLKRLSALYLQQPDRTSANPVCALAGYRHSVLAALPSLSNLDGERQPRSTSSSQMPLSYMELAAEVEQLKAQPTPPPAPLVLPAAWADDAVMAAAQADLFAPVQHLIQLPIEESSSDNIEGSDTSVNVTGMQSRSCSASGSAGWCEDDAGRQQSSSRTPAMPVLAASGGTSNKSAQARAAALVHSMDECRMLGLVLEQQTCRLAAAVGTSSSEAA